VVGPVDLTLYHLGLTWTAGPSTVMVALNRAKDTARSPWATADASVDSFGLAYVYSLSRRSALYAAGALASNKDQSRAALGAACCRGGWTTAPGEDSRVVQIGMRHSF
jgi:predicted porin